MLTLTAKIRQLKGKKTNRLRKNDSLPAVLYGRKLASIPLEVGLKSFEKVYKQAEKSSLINLKIENIKDAKEEHLILIHDVQQDPLTEKFIHVDFYQPRLKEKTEAKIILVFEGEAPAVKELGGTLIKKYS